MSYAKGTKTDASKTQSEIQTTLQRFGADGFMSGQQRLPDGTDAAMVAFQYAGKMVRFTMILPDRSSREFQRSPQGRVQYNEDQQLRAWDQACKSRWRALLLAIRAKLVAVEEGISTVEQEFLAWVVLPNGQTAGEHFLPQIEEAAKTGAMPALPFHGEGGVS
ncbi:MAG: hypothetical protein AAGB14_08405 [Verrucomicrobiota bacterium]